jgi:hypothetical protein
MKYSVHAMGVEYAQFRDETTAQLWAKEQSAQHRNCWWEVRDLQTNILIIAFQASDITYGRQNTLIGHF